MTKLRKKGFCTCVAVKKHLIKLKCRDLFNVQYIMFKEKHKEAKDLEK